MSHTIIQGSTEELEQLQLLVARRADQISQEFGCNRTHDRQVWLRAEFEILEGTERARPAVSASASPPQRMPELQRA